MRHEPETHASIYLTCRVVSRRLGQTQLDRSAGLDHPVLGDDHDAVSDEVALAVGVLDPARVHQARPIADAGVLVHDDPIQHDVAADSETWRFVE